MKHFSEKAFTIEVFLCCNLNLSSHIINPSVDAHPSGDGGHLPPSPTGFSRPASVCPLHLGLLGELPVSEKPLQTLPSTLNSFQVPANRTTSEPDPTLRKGFANNKKSINA